MIEIQNWETDRLIAYARNPRENDHAVDALASAIREFGFRVPIIAKSDGTIVDGHLRLKAAVKLGIDTVPVMLADDMTEAQVKAFRINVNRMAELANWDMDMLKLEIDDLVNMDFDLDLLGFDDEFLIDLDLGMDEVEGLTDEDEVPGAPETPTSKRGDIWILGSHRVMCGDSIAINDAERLMDGNKVDMVFTDPPYGVDYDGGHAVNGKRRDKLQNDRDSEIYEAVMPVIYIVSKDGAAVYLWFADSKSAAVTAAVTAARYDIRNTLIWNKNVAQFGAIGAQYKTKHEPCLYCFKRGKAPFWAGPNNEVSVWDISRCTKNEHHPTQKPVELAERAFGNSSKSGDVILDLFGGSGSTLIACEKTNRNCYMMELSENYVDVIIKRWQNFTGKEAVLESTGETYNKLSNG